MKLKAIAGFIILFLLYHAAEYCLGRNNNIAAFLVLMGTCIATAYFIARWMGLGGNAAWGLPIQKTSIRLTAIGLILGLIIYTSAFLARLALGAEIITGTPSFSQALTGSIVFILGTILPSLAEDILTRGYLYKFFHSKMSSTAFVLLSSIVFTANHIDRYDAGFTIFLFLFITGVCLAIPLAITGNLWYSFGMHWAGNIVYRITNDVLQTAPGSNRSYSMWVLILFVSLAAIINYFVSLRLRNRLLQTTGRHR